MEIDFFGGIEVDIWVLSMAIEVLALVPSHQFSLSVFTGKFGWLPSFFLWRKLYNDELHSLYSSPTVVRCD
jgi:hypothetical protein